MCADVVADLLLEQHRSPCGFRLESTELCPACSRDVDASFDHLIRSTLRMWLLQNNLGWVLVPDDLPFPTGANPPWWALVPVPQQPSFVARPVGAAAWLAWVNTLTNAALAYIQPTYNLRTATFVAEELQFGANPRERTVLKCDRRAGFCKGLESRLFLMDRTSLAKAETITQFGFVVADETQLVTYAGRTPTTAQAAGRGKVLQRIFSPPLESCARSGGGKESVCRREMVFAFAHDVASFSLLLITLAGVLLKQRQRFDK